jgi:hypothetical protein
LRRSLHNQLSDYPVSHFFFALFSSQFVLLLSNPLSPIATTTTITITTNRRNKNKKQEQKKKKEKRSQAVQMQCFLVQQDRRKAHIYLFGLIGDHFPNGLDDKSMVLILLQATCNNGAHTPDILDDQRESTSMTGIVGRGDPVGLFHLCLIFCCEEPTNVVG